MVPEHQRAVAEEVHHQRHARRQIVQPLERRVVELDAGVGAGDGEPMEHVAFDLVLGERFEHVVHRRALGERPQLGSVEQRQQPRLPYEHHLQPTLFAARTRQQENLFERVGWQPLRFVDEHDRKRLERCKRLQELAQRGSEVGQRRVGHPAAGEVGLRDDAEIDEDRLHEVFNRHERIGHKRRQRTVIELLQHGAAQHRLAQPGVARDDDHRVVTANRAQQLLRDAIVRVAVIEEFQV